MLAAELTWTDAINGLQTVDFTVAAMKGAGTPDEFLFVPGTIARGGDGSMRNIFRGFKRVATVDFGVVNSISQQKRLLYWVQDTNRKFGTTLDAPTGLSAYLPGLLVGPPAGTYYYVVSAVDEAGETAQSTQVSRTTVDLASTIRVTWNTVAGALYYCLYRSTTSGVYTNPCLLVRTAATTYDDVGLGTVADLKRGAPQSASAGYMALEDPFNHVVEWLDQCLYGRSLVMRMRDRSMRTYWQG